MRHTALLATAVIGFAGAANANAQIAAWGQFGQPGDQAFTAPTATAANVTGLDMTRGPGLNPNAGSNSLNSSGWDGPDPANDFVSFGFSVDAGFSVDLDSLIIGTRASNSGPGNLGLFYSGDGFSNNLFTFTQSGTNFLNSIIDLSSLNGLVGTIEFRIRALDDTRADGGTGISSAGTFRVVDFFDGDFTDTQFTGTVVPTPGAVGLFGLAGLVATRRRRA